jgi:excisionase family DNA binding protein
MVPPDWSDELLTVAEVASMLKLNQQTIRNWIDRGSLPAVYIGRRVRIRRADLEALLERGYTGRRGAPREGSQPAGDIWAGDVPPPEAPDA